MQVVISRDPKLSKIDHLFVVLAESSRPELPVSTKALKKNLDDSGFVGRGDEFVTSLADEPKKITFVGAGKEESLSIRGARAALYRIAKIAKMQRDASIAVVFPYVLPNLKITFVGAGKEESLSIRGARAALYRIAKIAKMQRDASIAVVFPYVLPKLT